ncbi:YidH family protein [Corynebacterium sp. A21]|uniref:YidH family protein n=1 Tax=Corynebacterium sp. A21 TaxID=3457318 RepID=UPI003FCF7EE2
MEDRPTRPWLSRTLLPEGEEPDPRFTLANERTFLAWTRTSLAFLGGGIALQAFPLQNISEEMRTWSALFVITMGLLISVGAAGRWLATERAMRKGKPLPLPAIVPLLSLACVVACILVMWSFS